MLMMLDITWMEEMLMGVALLWNLPRGYHVDLEGFESMLAGVLLLVLDAALTAVLMATGPEIARLETGRISVIAVGKEAILKGTARIVLRSTKVGATHDHLSDHILLAVAGTGVQVSAEVVATAGRGPLPEGEKLLSTKVGDQGVQAPAEAPC